MRTRVTGGCVVVEVIVFVPVTVVVLGPAVVVCVVVEPGSVEIDVTVDVRVERLVTVVVEVAGGGVDTNVVVSVDVTVVGWVTVLV